MFVVWCILHINVCHMVYYAHKCLCRHMVYYEHKYLCIMNINICANILCVYAWMMICTFWIFCVCVHYYVCTVCVHYYVYVLYVYTTICTFIMCTFHSFPTPAFVGTCVWCVYTCTWLRGSSMDMWVMYEHKWSYLLQTYLYARCVHDYVDIVWI